MNIRIPEGQRVRIRKYDAGVSRNDVKQSGNIITKRNIYNQKALDDINDCSFILMEPVTFNISSNFENLIETQKVSLGQYLGGELFKALGADSVAGVITGVTEYSGFQRWSSTNLIDTELSVGLIAKDDAYEDVVKPMLKLIKLTIPSINHSSSQMINAARTLRLPGPSIIKTLKQIFRKEDISGTEYTESDTEFTLCVGNLVFDHVVITGVTPTIMPDTDINGYPLSVFLKIRFKGTRIPNDEMIDDIFNGWVEGYEEQI